MPEQQIFTVNEAVEYMRLSRANIYRHFKSGQLKRVVVGGRTLLRKCDIDEFFAANVKSGKTK